MILFANVVGIICLLFYFISSLYAAFLLTLKYFCINHGDQRVLINSSIVLQFLCLQDCSWSEHGFSLANRYYTDIGTLLDEKFGTTYNLTYRT